MEMTETQVKATEDAISILRVTSRRLFGSHLTGGTNKTAADKLKRAIFHLEQDLFYNT